MNDRNSTLPQPNGPLFLTDGGMETTFVFHDGLDLPSFAAFDLFNSARGRGAIEAYYRSYLNLARQFGVGFIIETATWRANPDWGTALGYSAQQLSQVNCDAVALARTVAADYADLPQVLISGNLGPRGDAYNPATTMTVAEALEYHSVQVATFADCQVDLVTGMTITNVQEAAGIVLAAQRHQIPVVISFTVETDGALPTGELLADAISSVDGLTGEGPAYYMVNCAHPDHFGPALATGKPSLQRIGGIRANASRCSHAELDEADELDAGDPKELAAQYADLLLRYPHIRVLGGCCGTDQRHVGAIAAACMPPRSAWSAG